MRLRAENPHALPPRMYERRSVRRITWWVKDRDNGTRVLRVVPATANDAQIAAARAAAIAAYSLPEVPGGSRQGRTTPKHVADWIVRAGEAQPKAVKMRGVLQAWAATLYNDSKRRAVQRRIYWSLKQSEFAAIVARSAGICEVSGHPLSLTLGGKKGPYGPSIDRVRSDLGYTAGNVRLVCVAMNFAMNSWGLEAFLPIARALVNGSPETGLIPKIDSGITNFQNDSKL